MEESTTTLSNEQYKLHPDDGYDSTDDFDEPSEECIETNIGRWIPGEAYYNDELILMESALFGLICALSHDGPCTALNKFLADDLMCSTKSVEKYLHHLEKLGYINRRVFRDGKKVAKREITVNARYKERYRHIIKEERARRNPTKSHE